MKKIKCKKCQDTGIIFIKKIYRYTCKGRVIEKRDMGYFDVCECKKLTVKK